MGFGKEDVIVADVPGYGEASISRGRVLFWWQITEREWRPGESAIRRSVG